LLWFITWWIECEDGHGIPLVVSVWLVSVFIWITKKYPMKKQALHINRYQPNFADPRVQARVRIVLDFCRPLLLHRKPTPIASALLTKHFGNQKSQLSERLRAKLLIQSGTYALGKHSYSYTINAQGFEFLCRSIGVPMQSDEEMAADLYRDIASGKTEPQYSEPTKGARRYHPIQNLPKALRASLFKGWYDYDIEAAAPTLIYQKACRVRLLIDQKQIDQPYPAVRQLVEDRAAVRQHLMDVSGLDLKAAKGVLVALFFGARLVPHHKQAVYRLVGHDKAVIERLRADKYVVSFCREVRLMWTVLLNHENATNGLKALRTGVITPKPATKAKQRMGYYLRVERQVMDAIESVLRAQGMVPVLIHDGFMTKRRINTKVIEAEVLRVTGFKIRLAAAKIGASDEDLKFGLPEGEDQGPE